MKKPLDRLRLGVFERGFALGKISLGTSLGAGWTKVKGILASDDERAQQVRDFLASGAQRLAGEFGELKGSLMKAGQMLSVYGEQFLPPEINAILKTLQKDSPPLAWHAIEPILRKELGNKLQGWDVTPNPIGSASLGQVHLATHVATGRKFALKVRYPGVEKAIDSDLSLLKKLISVAGVLPAITNLDAVFTEARTMLQQEVDYVREFALTARYRALVADDPRFIVAEPNAELSTAGVLGTSYEPSVPVDSPVIAALSQERRNALATAFFDLYLRELFEFHAVQTDAHFGNFGVRLSENGEPDRWVLYDFGAVRELPEEFLASYRKLIHGALYGDRNRTKEALHELQLIVSGDPDRYVDALIDMAALGLESVRGPGAYRWGESDLPARVAACARGLMMQGRVRVPRAELLSLDRKTTGVFVVLAKLNAVIETRSKMDRVLRGDESSGASRGTV